jgi:hypothetical protein
LSDPKKENYTTNWAQLEAIPMLAMTHQPLVEEQDIHRVHPGAILL